MVDSRDWDQLKARFHEAQELPPDQWAGVAAMSFPHDPILRAELERLLAAAVAAGDFLETPALPQACAADERASILRVGSYELIERIGVGGMGEVYLARRSDDVYRKHVAVKLVRPVLGDLTFIRRFEHERDTLARLDHPNIAKLLDGGTTPDGVPFFVMDWVDGVPIDRYAAERRLSVADRLRLFQQVCSAAGYAHRNLVVHRDLKPANILVTSEGIPKLLDFGIAKLLAPSPSNEPMPTLTQGPLQMMTPEYASPEQLRGETITTATDIYSLGQILYELMTGTLPGDLRSKRLDEILHVVCDLPPERPSTAVRRLATRRSDDGGAGVRDQAPPDAVSNPRVLTGDLDAIVLMALRKEPERRYSSVEQLSADIDRYLSAQPVMARHGALSYRAGKFVRRHRLATGAALLLTGSVLAGVGGTVWQTRRAEHERARAERRFNEVRSIANSLLFELHDAIARLPGSTPVRQMLIRRALEYLDRLAQEGIADATFRQEVAAAYRRVGDVQGNPYIANVGDIPGAIASYRRSLEILNGARGPETATEGHRRAMAQAHERLGDVLVITGDVTGGLESHRRALEARKVLVAAGTRNWTDQGDLAVSHSKVGQALFWHGDAAAALAHHREALKLLEPFASDTPADLNVQLALISSLIHAGDVLLATNVPREALAMLRRAEDLASQWIAAEPSNPRVLRQLAISHTKIGEVLATLQDVAGAVASQRAALALRSAISTADPENAQAKRDVAISHLMLASTLARAGRGRDVDRHLEAGIALFEKIAEAAAESVLARSDLVAAHNMAGSTWVRASDPGRALPSLERAIALGREIVITDRGDADTRQELASAYTNAGDAYRAVARRTRGGSEGFAHWEKAKASYEGARRELLHLESTGGQRATGLPSLALLEKKIAECDAASGR